MPHKPLDFIVIGAIKGGTTSLFHHLSQHPDVFLPRGKEYNFFTRDEWFERGWEWFASEYFGAANPERTWGLVTPGFMADAKAPERIAGLMPQTKLVAILRNPVDRALSEWQMTKRRGFESRGLEQALEEQLATPIDGARRFSAADTGSYLQRGTYARILERYLELFPHNQLHVMFLEDFEARPEPTYAALLQFLQLQPQQVDLRRKYHEGGSRKRFPNLLKRLVRVKPLKLAWHLLPRDIRKQILLRYETDINIDRSSKATLSPAWRSRLVGYFAEDARRLAALGASPPWPEFASSAAPSHK